MFRPVALFRLNPPQVSVAPPRPGTSPPESLLSFGGACLHPAVKGRAFKTPKLYGDPQRVINLTRRLHDWTARIHKCWGILRLLIMLFKSSICVVSIAFLG